MGGWKEEDGGERENEKEVCIRPAQFCRCLCPLRVELVEAIKASAAMIYVVSASRRAIFIGRRSWVVLLLKNMVVCCG